jgi:hypothetical protein
VLAADPHTLDVGDRVPRAGSKHSEADAERARALRSESRGAKHQENQEEFTAQTTAPSGAKDDQLFNN